MNPEIFLLALLDVRRRTVFCKAQSASVGGIITRTADIPEEVEIQPVLYCLSVVVAATVELRERGDKEAESKLDACLKLGHQRQAKKAIEHITRRHQASGTINGNSIQINITPNP